MFGMGMPELLCVLAVMLLLFGAKRLPDVGRSLGRAISSFKEGLREDEPLVPKKSPSEDSK